MCRSPCPSPVKPIMRRVQSPTSLARPFSLLLTLAVLTGCGQKWTETVSGIIRTVTNCGGQTLGYATASGVKLFTVDGLACKDLSRNGELDPYEDWRRPTEERAMDLASRMTVEQIAGLMLYSAHQAISVSGGPFGMSTYDGKPFADSGANAWDLSDDQQDFLAKDGVRHVLITSVESPEVAACWNNNVQALVEGIGLGIPANNSSDPRHRSRADAEFNAGSGGGISIWPDSISLAIPSSRHRDGSLPPDRSSHRSPLVSFQRHIRGRSGPGDRHGSCVRRRLPVIRR